MVKVTTDSTCDLSGEIVALMGIDLAPLHVIIDGNDYRDGVNITSEDIFRFVDTEGKSCSTSAITPHEYVEFFSGFADKYDALVHIRIGSGFSSCFQNALIAASGFKNVFVVDSTDLSTGSGHLKYDAAMMAKEGKDAKQILSAF